MVNDHRLVASEDILRASFSICVVFSVQSSTNSLGQVSYPYNDDDHGALGR